MKDTHKARIVVPVEQEIALTKYEAAEYSNIGINKIEAMLREPNCPFVLYVGPNKKLVKGKEFEEFISASFMI
ncbi:MAG: DNA-binding protein [Oscillospiraceae bacterium]|nr:DNA-binding protein [Oscillospiraceae bacterium]